MFIKNFVRKKVKNMVAEEVAKTSVSLTFKDLKVKVKHGGDTYEATVKARDNTILIGDFKKIEQ